MKRALMVLLAVILLFAGGCIKREPSNGSTDAMQSEHMDFSENTLIRDETVHSLLICAVAYDEKGYSSITSLSVLVRSGAGSIDILTIPKDTRVWIEHYDSQGEYQYCDYGSIKQVYHAAEAAGLGEEKTREAVESLLGGVYIDNYVLLNVVQLENLAELTDGVHLTVEDAIPDCAIPAGFQDIRPKIADYASYSYLNDIGGVDYPGTDLYKLQRHQQLITTLMQNFAMQMAALDDAGREELAQGILSCLRTDLVPQALQQWLTGNELDFRNAEILSGMQSEWQNESYWIPDVTALKEWVLQHFYQGE